MNHESTIILARPDSRRWQQKNYGSAKNVLQLHRPLTQSTLGWSVINKDKEWTDGRMDGQSGFQVQLLIGNSRVCIVWLTAVASNVWHLCPKWVYG